MTDREMLELAAKAAGIKATWNERHKCFYFRGDEWWPLEDDGDALRLAVALGIGMSISGSTTIACSDAVQARECDFDVYAATRRAIVRAAAEIGRAMG